MKPKPVCPTAADLKKPSPRMILSFGRCTHSAQFFSGFTNNELKKTSYFSSRLIYKKNKVNGQRLFSTIRYE